MDLSTYRSTPAEQARVSDLLDLIPRRGQRALDVGTRDGFLAKLLAERFDEVDALDLERPDIRHPRIRPVKGSVAKLPYPDRYFDMVLCAEVLEHIPPDVLPLACREICRVSRAAIVIGVPYRQDLRLGRTTCENCGKRNPPWGHVNSFDEARLKRLFSDATIKSVSFVGETRSRTNWLSAALMDFAGNPFGTWTQAEACVHCGGSIGQPKARTVVQKVATRLAVNLNELQMRLTRPRGNWIHLLLETSPAVVGSTTTVVP